MIDPHRLRVFRAVVAAGSIRGAAENLGYTASAVSQQVAALQRDTGLTLIARSGRGIEPTGPGREVAALGAGVLASLDEVERRVRDLRDSRTSTITLAYFSSVGTAWMPGVVQALSRDFPALRPQLVLNETGPVRVDDEYDLRVVVQDPEFSAPAGLHAELLLTEPYLAVVPADHPLAAAGTVDLAALAGDVWISNDVAGGWCHRNLLNACTAAGFQPDYGVQAPEHPTALAFVGTGAGITVLPRLCLQALPAGLATVALRNPTPQRSVFAVTGATHDQPAVRVALAQLRAEAART